jgi:hypothetical protein
MATKGKGGRVRRSASEQRTMLARYAASGQTAAVFCRGERISTASLYRWRGLHGKSGEQQAQAQRTAGFVDLGALGLPARDGRRLEVKLDLGEGVVLHLVRG